MGPPAPQLGPRLYEAVRDLADELIIETDGRERVASSTPEDLLVAAETFARCRLTTLPIIRQSDLVARSMSPQDLRELDRLSFPEMQQVMQILSHFTPRRPAAAPMRRTLLAKKLLPRRGFAFIPLTFPLWAISSRSTS